MSMSWENALWLGVPGSEIEKWKILEGDMTGRFAYYRCEFEADGGAGLTVAVAANSRYRLWVNAVPVHSGPCKGDRYRQFYDCLNLTEYLRKGKNVLAVQVLYCDPDAAVYQTDERASIFSVVSPGGGHRLAVEGDILDRAGTVCGTVTTGKADWKVYLDGSFYLKSTEVTENLGAVCEEIDCARSPLGWKNLEFSAEDWAVPVPLETVKINSFMNAVGLVQKQPMKEREIPLMYEREERFSCEISTTEGILKTGSITVPAQEEREFILDAGAVKNGYPVFRFRDGKGAQIRITYFEKFLKDGEVIRRDDAEHGEVKGITDSLILDGKAICYEPFWVRTFRFLRVQVRTAGEAVTAEAPWYHRTGYPLEVTSRIHSSESWVDDVWKMSVRTLENCMLETYMDCPYYEQMQFPMDTRLQAMFNYCVSTDVRLARKALEDYHCSMIPEGLIHGKYPSAYPQIISTFSLHYIYMLWEFYWQTEEVETVKKYLPDMDMILAFYDRKTGEKGMVGRLGYWEFVDWQPAWGKTAGIPGALTSGPSTIINLMYGYALLCAAKLNRALGRDGIAEEYEARQRKITEKVQELCWDEGRQMYREGPQFLQFTQHAQAWAVLNNMADTETARKMLTHAQEEEDVLKVTFSTSYEWFRALEQTGLYGMTEKNMELWKGLPALGCTTCPETPGETRSDCHAWSALPIYEMIRAAAGVSAAEPGWKKVRICPHMEYLPDLEGEAAAPGGTVGFSYQRTEDGGMQKFTYRVTLPAGTDAVFCYADGREEELSGGKQYELAYCCKGK